MIVIMGSGGQTAAETASYLAALGEKVGVVQVRLFRPFPAAAVLAAIPASARRVAVLDRTKEPGSLGEPLFLDVLAALAEAHAAGDLPALPLVTGGRYGLSSKEFTPAMVAGIFAELTADRPRPRFTIGITDDVTGTSLPYDPVLDIEPGRDGAGAVLRPGRRTGPSARTRTAVTILGADPARHAQAYFVYDSKKSGSETVSHLRFGPTPIKAPYLISQAGFVGCHQARMIAEHEVLDRAAAGATVLLDAPYPADEVWDSLPREAQEQILAKQITLYAIDASKVARDAGLGKRANTVLQTCFFAISGVMPRDEAIKAIKAAITKTYSLRGPEVVAANEAAVDASRRPYTRSSTPGG